MLKKITASGFLGLTVMMIVGLYQFTLLAGGQGVPGWMIGGHAHLGVLWGGALIVSMLILLVKTVRYSPGRDISASSSTASDD